MGKTHKWQSQPQTGRSPNELSYPSNNGIPATIWYQLHCFESMVRVLLGLCCLWFIRRHPPSHKCSQECPFEVECSRLVISPIRGSLGGIGERASRNRHLCLYTGVSHVISYRTQAWKYCILFTGGRKVSKRKFPISEEHSGATSNSNCSVRIKGHWWKYLSLSSGDGQRKAFNCSHINPYVPSLFFLATGSNKSYIRISQLKLVMKMAHWVRCRLEVFILSFSFHTYLAQDEHACWVGHLR